MGQEVNGRGSRVVGAVSRRSFLGQVGIVGGTMVGAGSLGALLQGCSSADSEEASDAGTPAAAADVVRGGSLRVGMRGEPDLLDPARSALAASQIVWHHVFGRLVRIMPDESIEPDLAVRWEAEDDGRTWLFELRDDVTFHNGDPFTAEDVKYTFERIADPDLGSPWVSKFPQFEEIEVVDTHNVRFHLAEPFAPFLVSLALNGQIVNRQAVESDDAGRAPIGTGPFKLTEWVSTDHLVLERNSEYFDSELPYLDDASVRFVEISPSQVNGLRADNLDYMSEAPPQLLEELQDDSELTLVTSATSGKPQVIGFNTTEPPFDNKEVRQAIAWAIDRSALHQVALFGAGEPGSEEVPSGSTWYDNADPFQEGPDLERASEHLARSGVETPISFEFLAWTSEPYPTRVGELLRDQLRPLGFEVNIQQIEISEWVPRLLGREFQMTVAFNEGTVDPDNLYSLFLKSDSNLNFSGYNNPEFDDLVEQARAEQDEARRRELYQQVRALVFEDVPLFFYHYDTPYYVMRNDVLGATARPSLELGLEYVSLAG